MAKQEPYKELFRVGEIVEVAHAPREGESEPEWIRGTVAHISTRLHVAHEGLNYHVAYPRADYNRGLIRKVPRVAASPSATAPPTSASSDTSISVEHVDITEIRRPDFDDTPLVRLYSMASAVTHGRENARYALQIFGRRRLGRGQVGFPHVATASLGIEALRLLGTAVDAAIRDIEGDHA